MVNKDDLVEYIAQQLRLGASERLVRESLARHGWSAQQIDDGFVRSRERDALSLPMPLPKAAEPGRPGTKPPAIPETEPLPADNGTGQGSSRLASALRLGVTVLLAASLVIVLLVGSRTLLGRNDNPAPPAEVLDTQRKHQLDGLASKLEAYRDSNGHYPTLDEINDVRFPDTPGGFDARGFRDPQWQDDNQACSDGGRPAFTARRSRGCFAYRVTAENGDVCDNRQTPCDTAFITAELSTSKPHVIMLNDTGRETR